MTIEQRIQQQLGAQLFTIMVLETENEKLRLENAQLKEGGGREDRGSSVE